MSNKPQNIEEYKKWYKEMFEEDIFSYEPIYNTNSASILAKLNTSELIVKLNLLFEDLRYKYYSETEAENLFLKQNKLELVSKPFTSVVSKTYRKNILHNKDFPIKTQIGWINHDNWYEKINDMFRGVIYVKYLDGIKYIVSGLEEFCKENQIKYNKFYEARDEGYYGAHFYIETKINVINRSWQTEQKLIKIEIQITTELKGLIKTLLHTYYEDSRDKKKDKNSLPWQWEYDNNEFEANYLGHLIHNIEASILRVRNKIKEEKL